MAKFIKAFLGCTGGEVYPTEFAVGDDCPKDLEEAARSTGALPAKGKKLTAAEQKAIDEALAAQEAAEALKVLETALTEATEALAADPENAELQEAKAQAEKALLDAQPE